MTRSCKRLALNQLSMMNLQHDIIRGVVKDADERVVAFLEVLAF